MEYALVVDSIQYDRNGKPYIFPECILVGTYKDCVERLWYELSMLQIVHDSNNTESAGFKYRIVDTVDEYGTLYTFNIHAIGRF